MIHDGLENLNGTCKSVEAWAKFGTKSRQQMYEIYLSRMKAAKPRMTSKKIEEMCSHDTILSASKAVDHGLADWVLETLDDPYRFYATDTQNAKWKPAMKLGKHEVEEEIEGEE
jgi:ATP-dependent protease ClpP protease subunit